MIPPSRHRARLSFDDALAIWQAREVHRVQSVLTGMVILVFCGEVLSFLLLGFWLQGLLLIGLQWALLRGLLWVLRWTRRRLFRWQFRRHLQP